MPVHVNINPLSWESAFFGVDTVRLEPQGDIPLEQALRHPCALMQIKVAASETALIDTLQQHQFRLAEGEADLTLAVKQTERQAGIRIAREAQIPLLRDAASQLFSQSRFRAPWYAPDASGRFYAQ